MTELWLREAVAASGLPPPTSYPRNLARDAGMELPELVTMVVLKGLTSASVASWLTRMGIDHSVPSTSRRFRGCMVANKGRALLFRDSNDNEDEQRFTLAHEVSHFVLDHLMPRARVLKRYGASFLAVLDALRPPTRAEQLALALDQLPIGIQVKLMERDAAGVIQSGSVAQAEWRADRLAFELLAPADVAYPYLKSVNAESGPSQLAARFGLPLRHARTYARMLTRRERVDASSVVQFHR